MIDHKAQGKRNRATGADFERRVRADLMAKDFVVTKWGNNVKDGVCYNSKPSRFKMASTGFPDFMYYCKFGVGRVAFVECKVNGYITPKEREKALWYLKNGYCEHFYVASKSKVKNKIIITYKEIKNE